jgi:hypothetical protein
VRELAQERHVIERRQVGVQQARVVKVGRRFARDAVAPRSTLRGDLAPDDGPGPVGESRLRRLGLRSEPRIEIGASPAGDAPCQHPRRRDLARCAQTSEGRRRHAQVRRQLAGPQEAWLYRSVHAHE